MYEIIKSNVIKRLRIVTNSLQFRLISAFCLISILPLVFINLMSYYNTTGIVQENTDELAEVNLVQTDKSVRSTLAAYEDLLFQLYTGDDIVNDVDELNAGGNEGSCCEPASQNPSGNCEYQGFDTMHYHHYRIGRHNFL